MKDKEIMSGIVKAGPRTRWTVKIIDNLKGDEIEVHTNCICGAIKNSKGDGAYVCNFADANGADVLTTILTAFTAIKSLSEQTDHLDNFKGMLLLELQKLKPGGGVSKWLN